ncbi:MAG: hypothetical protein K6F52_04165, partial [Clostridia bacterium]|nr:hypothetical protein [Clostridia bacterium]
MDLSMNMAILSQMTGSNAAKVSGGGEGSVSTENASSFQSLLSRLTNSDNTENSICSQIDSSMDANPENIMSTDIA